VFKKLAV